jgi:hypothetical protein
MKLLLSISVVPLGLVYVDDDPDVQSLKASGYYVGRPYGTFG